MIFLLVVYFNYYTLVNSKTIVNNNSILKYHRAYTI